MKKKEANINFFSRRSFLGSLGLGAATMGLLPFGCSPQGKQKSLVIPGFDETIDESNLSDGWVPFSERKIRVGLVGYGASKFSAAFGFQNHPNVKIEAVSDLFPDRCAALAERVGCDKTYPSLEELVKDDQIEAVFVATDAPSHPRHCIEVLKHGKHVAVAVPVTYGDILPGLIGWEYHGLPVAERPNLEIIAGGKLSAPSKEQHAAVIYPGPKGNWVFNAGTIWWTEGLSNPPGHIPAGESGQEEFLRPGEYPAAHDPGGRTFGVMPEVQKITANVLDRMINDSPRK